MQKIRRIIQADLDNILVIEQSAHIAPWTRETFKACFQAKCIAFGIEEEKHLLGFIISTQHTDECHILNLCVSRERQHQGIGTKLLQHALWHAKITGAGIAYLEVRRSNSRAISLYKKMHFQVIGERKNYYPTVNGQEDALVLAKNLITE